MLAQDTLEWDHEIIPSSLQKKKPPNPQGGLIIFLVCERVFNLNFKALRKIFLY
jgi:hypothetical protein